VDISSVVELLEEFENSKKKKKPCTGWKFHEDFDLRGKILN
jgi:hypothetical protein